MRFLFVSNFPCKPDSGSGGTLYSLAETLRQKGHEVDAVWKMPTPFQDVHFGLSELYELPRQQFDAVSKKLQEKSYEVVSISQPFSYSIYEKLAPRYPQTLFLNRTHGWEDRIDHVSSRWRGEENLVSRVFASGRALLNRRACMRTVQNCQGLIAASSLCADYILKHFQMPAEKIAVIPHGLPAETLRFPMPARPAESFRKMLYVGNYLKIKGTRVLEKLLPSVAADHPHAQMTFVVPADDVRRIQKIYEPFFGARLSVLPWMSREELLKVYASHGILLYPSLFEGFCKAVLEAMALGMCVVGFDEGGVTDIAESGRQALYCQTGDLQAFRQLLDRALLRPETGLEIGKNAYEAARGFSWDKAMEKMLDFCLRRRQALGMK